MLRIDFQKSNFFSESGPGKHFQGSGIRAIDSPHKITLRKINFRVPKNHKDLLFLANPVLISLNQGQRSVLKVRECAQSIPRMK